MERNTEEDAMSLCDLLMHDCNAQDSKDSTWEILPSSPTSPHFFEFPILTTSIDHMAIPFPSNDKVVSGLVTDSDTYRSVTHEVNQKRSASVKSPETGKRWYRRLSSGKQCKVVFGVLQVRPEMELTDIKKRQGRMGPLVLKLPPVDEGERAIAGVKVRARRDGWALLRPCRIGRLLAKSLVKAAFPCLQLHVKVKLHRSDSSLRTVS